MFFYTKYTQPADPLFLKSWMHNWGNNTDDMANNEFSDLHVKTI